jgi:hypothetical protein
VTDSSASLIALNLELDKVRRLHLVQKAYPTLDFELMVVKLRIDHTVGLHNENFLFYSAKDFSVARVTASINKIIAESL